MNTKCAAITKAGSPCRAWAVRESDPPRCSAHGRGKAPIGAPAGNQNAKSHGLYTNNGKAPFDLDARITDLDRRVQQLSLHIDNNLHSLEADEYNTLFGLQGALTSRLGRLMRDRQQVTSVIDDLDEAVKEALTITSHLIGTDLLPGQPAPKKRTLTPHS